MTPEKELRVRMTFTEDLLGTASADPDIYMNFIASKAPDKDKAEEELKAIENDEEDDDKKSVEDMKITVFPRGKNGQPILWDYQIKGFFKDTCGGLKKVSGSQSSKIKAFKKEIDKLIFITPREIPINYQGEITICQRPLRASTPLGERIAIAASESIPAGAWVEFTVQLLTKEHEKAVIEWLDYAKFSGIGQWRNSGKGRAYYELLDENGNVIGGNKD